MHDLCECIWSFLSPLAVLEANRDLDVCTQVQCYSSLPTPPASDLSLVAVCVVVASMLLAGFAPTATKPSVPPAHRRDDEPLA